ncbi:hypothetical protein FE257_007151 [Aspergillus nanangensis]|uniref:FAD-binding oxidoreductase/transferase type 4 C-terminal domain-containing protein n=1 Tax=Aspergillus nanangensis TaxID=2582783 RepID=A0AAD4CNT2_ASPNN|nr:hypothetical protein FE257_007151 [Aspergillus nanangensis]
MSPLKGSVATWPTFASKLVNMFVTPVGSWDYRGPGGHTCFAPIIPPSASELDVWYKKVKQRVTDAGFDFFADFHVYPRYIVAIAVMVFTPDEAGKMDRLYKELVGDGFELGHTEYRTHVHYMDHIADHFKFNDSILRKYVEQLKDVTDPKGILAPGKQGIWGTSSLAQTYQSKS